MSNARYWVQRIGPFIYAVIDRKLSNSIDGDHWICQCTVEADAEYIADAMNRINFDL